MTYHKLLLYISAIAYFIVQAHALPAMLVDTNDFDSVGESAADPLDPGLVGESMSTPLPEEFVQEAKKAGVITESNPLYNPDNKQSDFSVTPQPKADADNSMDNINITGAWSFDLKGKTPEQMKLYLVQNKEVVRGQGVINRENETEKATANGSILRENMSLTVMPVGVSDIYRLNLSLSSLAAGTYTVYLADGGNRSGKVTFAVSSNIFKSAFTVAEENPDA